VRFEKGDLKLTQVDDGSSFGLRVVRDRRLGFASTNQQDNQRTASDALSLAAMSLPDEANVLPEPQALPSRPSLVNQELTQFGIEQAVDQARSMVTDVLAVNPRISLDQASLDVRKTSVAVASSTGIEASESDADISASVFGMAVDGDDVGGFDYWGDHVRSLSQLPLMISDLVERFSSAALGNLGAGASESYRGPVLFAPSAFDDIFIAPLVSAASAIAVQRGRSALAGKVGSQVAAPMLSVTDDPTDLSLGGACCFDREGQPTQIFPLIEQGVLQGLLHNGYSAQVEGCRSTGHSRGGARSVPGLGPHGIVVAPGTGGDRTQMLAALHKGLLVQRFSGSVDPASGDFSGVAKSARWVEGGKVVRPVRETLISGNAFDLLGHIKALSSHVESLMGSGKAPWALVDGLSVTAG
jgi:PmbA protein